MIALFLSLLRLVSGGTPATEYATPYRNLKPAVAYIGSAACTPCHSREASTYPATAMGRAFASVSPEKIGLPPGGVTFVNENSHIRYRVFMEGGRLKHSQTVTDEQGKEVFTDTRTISWVLGSGDRGQTFIVQQGNRLYESAVAYRPRRDGWGMAAGFESAPPKSFMRPVMGPCLFCHSNRALFVEGSINEYREPIFDGLEIGCERCHGPGSLHVNTRRSKPPGMEETDDTIVNPRRLPPELRDGVCFQCHLQGDSRVLKSGHRLFDFRPGLRLADFVAVYHAERPSLSGRDEGIEVVSHVERLRQSRCWKASGGRVTCLTCHDPHRTPRGEEASRQFRGACLTCHKPEDCRVKEMAGDVQGDPLDCVRCHMAKLPPTDAPHTLFTDHLIARRPASAAPAAPPPPIPPQELTLVDYLEQDRGSRRDLGVAYLIYAERQGDTRLADRGASTLEPLMSGLRGDVNALRLMAEHYGNTGRSSEAASLLERLVAIAPQVSAFKLELARVRQRAGKEIEARALVEKALEEDAKLGSADLLMGDLLMKSGRRAEAEAKYRLAVRFDPGLAQAHGRVGDLLLGRGDLDGALRAYRTAIALNPDLIAPRLGVANVHIRRKESDAAISELRHALDHAGDDKERAAVRFQVARLLAAGGRTEEAMAELERVLAAVPEHADARGLLRRLRGQ